MLASPFHLADFLTPPHAWHPASLRYNTKVVQFGYVAMFSSAFPLAPVIAALHNFIELRLDAVKFLQARRPRYAGAQHIGSWGEVLSFMSWAALLVNVLILVFTSWEFRERVRLTHLIASQPCSEAFSLPEPV